jgi:hypothetical protein
MLRMINKMVIKNTGNKMLYFVRVRTACNVSKKIFYTTIKKSAAINTIAANEAFEKFLK